MTFIESILHLFAKRNKPVAIPFRYDHVMQGVVMDIASERALIQQFGAASKIAGDPRSFADKQKWKNDWLHGYDTGSPKSSWEIYQEMFAEDKARHEANH